MTAPSASPCVERRLVDRHFAARIAPVDESALRAHLPGCPPCRRHYERHLLLARLVPGRPRLEDRLAAGLGLGHRGPPFAPTLKRLPSPRSWTFAAVAATALALLVVTRAPLPSGTGFTPRGGGENGTGASLASDFTPRGGGENGTGASLAIYRVAADGSTQSSRGWMEAGDELAFAYRNPAGFSRLLVFGADDRGGIYWFHPAWTDPADDPVAVPIEAGTGPFELTEAIRHHPWGSRLRVVALFTNTPLSVRALEAAWRAGSPDPQGSVRIEVPLEVRR